MSCLGHARRDKLRQKLSDARAIPGKEIDTSKKINVTLGAGKVVEWGLKELTEEERKSPEWQAVANGGLRVIPVTEFRLDSLPKPNEEGKVEFETKRRKE